MLKDKDVKEKLDFCQVTFSQFSQFEIQLEKQYDFCTFA